MKQIKRRWSNAARYGISILIVGVATLIGLPFHSSIEPANLVMLYLAAVVIIAVYLGRGPSILASLLGVLIFDFIFVEPRLSFSVYDTQYLITFAGLLVVGLIISGSAAQLRDRMEKLRQREAQTAALNSLSRELTGAAGMAEVLSAVNQHVHRSLESEAAIFLGHENELKQEAITPGLVLSDADRSMVHTVFATKAGQSTDNSFALPLLTSRGIVGVLLVVNLPISTDQRQLAEGFANLAALAVERVYLAAQNRQMEILETKEKLQAALLNSISHELRTPLSVITGTLSSILDSSEPSIPISDRAELIETAYEEAERLNMLVGNLLDMTRLEAGAYHLKRELCDMQDLIGIALERLDRRLVNRPVVTNIQSGLPLIYLDETLFVQVIVNVIDNSLKYSPDGSPIEIDASASPSEVVLRVSDHGAGIPPAELESIFSKFHRLSSGADSGIGLGLAICRGIVEAHGGKITAGNRPEGGAVFTVSLPQNDTQKVDT
jgi:two-component system sensor histidine kinase KdpD